MKTVFVGMSGGVDSSVTAALLQRQGYDVVGVYMKNWTEDVGGVDCPWRRDLADARAVAAGLGIELRVFDFQTEYKAKVVDYMVSEYRAGRTPNPDIMCNQEIKFKLFLDTAIAAGADLIATGHYARVEAGRLLKGIDAAKDQSYFLARMPAAALERTLMPLGAMHKAEVRRLAAELNLPTATKPDSQGICFVGEIGIKAFLGQYIESVPGPIKTEDGAVIGTHDGAVFYTLGQRHGLGVGGGRPYYVTGRDVATNAVYVSDQPRTEALFSDRFIIEQLHWLENPAAGRSYQVLTRHLGNLIEATLEPDGQDWTVQMVRSERAVTPGQTAAVYDGERLIGSGIIKSARPALATHHR